MKTFYILNHRFLPTPYNHRFFVEKFARGFSYHGFKVEVVSKISEIKEPGFIMISNHYFYHRIGLRSLKNNELSNYLRKSFLLINKLDKTGLFKKVCELLQNSVIVNLSKKIKNNENVVLAWFWNDRSDYLERYIKNVIFVGEKHYDAPHFDNGNRWYKFYKEKNNALPIEFSADIDPDKITLLEKDIFVGFVGNKNYKKDWYELFLSHDECKIVPTPPFISEEKRLDVYKRSKIILGLHSDDNIKNHVVVERVFESLAFGCICLTDNKDAENATDGCAIFIESKDELLSFTKKIYNDNELFLKISKNGLKFSREKGTYFYQASKFIDFSKNNFNILFK